MPTAPHPPKLTTKGALTRDRILQAAAGLIYEHGVAATTIEDVKSAAAISGSQLYHYFADKEALVRAVIDYQADHLVANQERADLGTVEGLRAWRDFVVDHTTETFGRGGCPLGSLGGQVAEGDLEARTRLSRGFDRWSTAIADGLQTLHRTGRLASGVDPERLAVTLLAAVQGGLVLAQVQRDSRPLATALDTVLSMALA